MELIPQIEEKIWNLIGSWIEDQKKLMNKEINTFLNKSYETRYQWIRNL